MSIQYDKVPVKCTDNGIVNEAEVEYFKPRDTLVVWLANQKLTFKPGGLSGNTWVANAYGLEFTTVTPTEIKG